MAVLTALTATLAFSPAGAVARPDARVAAPTVIKNQQSGTPMRSRPTSTPAR
jgi:hypothetical protein